MIKKEVERERNLNGAGAAVDGRWQPVDGTVAVNQHVDIQGDIKLAVVTAEGTEETSGSHQNNR